MEPQIAGKAHKVADGGRLSEDVFCRIMRSYGKVGDGGSVGKQLHIRLHTTYIQNS